MAEVHLGNDSRLLSVMNERVSVVLVETSHSGNIGAVARAMRNMGIANLRLVKPKDFPSDEAGARAAGALELLESASVYPTLSEAVADCHYVVGASARVRSFPWPVMNPRESAEFVVNELLITQTEASSSNVAYVFGRESSGLSNEELQQCNAHVHIPANPEYSSLNLAMAVQVMAYELRMACLASSQTAEAPVLSPDDEGWDAEACTHEEVEGMLAHLSRVMIATEFFDPQNPGQLLPRLRRLFQRRGLDKMEVNILRGMLKSIEKKLQR